MKKLIRKAAKKFGFDIRPLKQFEPLDLREVTADPMSILYYSRFEPVVINIPMNKGNTSRFFKTESRSYDPYIFAVTRAIQEAGDQSDKFEEICMHYLNKSREMIQPANAAEKMGLTHFSNSKLTGYPDWSFVFPWSNETIEHKLRVFPQKVKLNRKLNGLDIHSDDPEEIMRMDKTAPVPSAYLQYSNLYKSIKENGYNRDNGPSGDITANIFSRGDDWIWVTGGDGNHRTIIVAALDFKEIPVRVTGIIRREDAGSWPNVIRGLYTEEEALHVFDRIFEANPPDIYNKWIHYVTALKQ